MVPSNDSDWMVFGQLDFDAALIDPWRGELGDRLVALLEFDQHDAAELLRVDAGAGVLRVRAWLQGRSLNSWAPKLQALFDCAGRRGLSGEVLFSDGDGRALRLRIEGARARVAQVAPVPADHPGLVEVALLVEAHVAALAAGVPQRSGQASQTSGR